MRNCRLIWRLGGIKNPKLLSNLASGMSKMRSRGEIWRRRRQTCETVVKAGVWGVKRVVNFGVQDVKHGKLSSNLASGHTCEAVVKCGVRGVKNAKPSSNLALRCYTWETVVKSGVSCITNVKLSTNLASGGQKCETVIKAGDWDVKGVKQSAHLASGVSNLRNCFQIWRRGSSCEAVLSNLASGGVTSVQILSS